MEIAFARLLHNDTRFFKQVIVDMSADRVALKVKVNVHVFAESRRIIIAVRLGVAERFQNRIRLQQDILHAILNKKENYYSRLHTLHARHDDDA